MGVYKASLGYIYWESRLLSIKQELMQVLMFVVQLENVLESVRVQIW